MTDTLIGGGPTGLPSHGPNEAWRAHERIDELEALVKTRFAEVEERYAANADARLDREEGDYQ